MICTAAASTFVVTFIPAQPVVGRNGSAYHSNSRADETYPYLLGKCQGHVVVTWNINRVKYLNKSTKVLHKLSFLAIKIPKVKHFVKRSKNKRVRTKLLNSSLKICHLFSSLSVFKNLSPLTFSISSSGSHIPPTHSHACFIITLIYISMTHMPLTFSTHFLLHFLKPLPSQMVTNYGRRMEY